MVQCVGLPETEWLWFEIGRPRLDPSKPCSGMMVNVTDNVCLRGQRTVLCGRPEKTSSQGNLAASSLVWISPCVTGWTFNRAGTA